GVTVLGRCLFFLVEVGIDVGDLGDGSDQQHGKTAEHLEVHPVVVEVESHEEVGGADDEKGQHPAEVEAGPAFVGHGDHGVEHAACHVLAADELAAKENGGDQPVHYRSLPFQ